MTTIAWDGRFLAADTLMVQGGGYRTPAHFDKLRLGAGKVAYGITGVASRFGSWVRWHADGEPLPTGDDKSGNFLVLTPEGIEVCNLAEPYLLRVPAPDAWGMGCEYAIGAMLFGATAVEAVAVAIQANVHTGGLVRYIDTHRDEWRIEEWNPDHFASLWPGNRPGWQWPFKLAPEERVALAPAAWDSAKLRDDEQLTAMVIPKPSPYRDGWATPECTGRLIDGNGCGHCKRCNREWHALRREARKDDAIPMAELRIDQDQHIEGKRERPSDPMAALQDWVERWNTAAMLECPPSGRMLAHLNAELRSMILPEGVEIIEETDIERGCRQKRLINRQ
jgi:hypothetical protein